MITILRVKKTPLFDVFLNSGWKNHVRVFYKNGKVSFVGKSEIRLTPAQIYKVKEDCEELVCLSK